MNQKPTYRTLNKPEHFQELTRKVVEEARELSNAEPHKLAEEIADIEQALDDLQLLFGIAGAEVAKIKRTKLREKGGLQTGLYIETLELDDNDPWVAYYRKDPEKYPES